MKIYAHLSLHPNRLEAEEELERVDEVTLNEDGGSYYSCGPVSRNNRDVVEPLF